MGGAINNFLGWFLLVLFYVTLIFYFLQKVLSKKSKNIIIIGLIINVILILIMDVLRVNTKLHFEIIPMAFLFYYSGYIAKNLTNIKKLQQIWIFMIPIVVIISYWNKPVKMYDNSYGNLILFFIGAFCGIIMICELSKALEKNQILSWFGKNSIIVYVTHFIMIKTLHFIGKKIIPEVSECNYLYPANWHYFLLIVLLMVPTIYICNRWFYVLFGKKKVNY